MIFGDILSAHSEKLRNIFDLAACCYDYLSETVGNQESFIGEYILENENAETVNPNLRKLEHLSGWIEGVLWERTESGLPFVDCMAKIRLRLLNLKLQEYGEAFLNEAAVPFFVLRAVDRCAQEMRGVYSDQAPLNKSYCEKSYIYLNIEDKMLDEAASENNFSNVIRGSDIRSQLDHLIIVARDELSKEAGAPRVVKLWIADTDDKRKEIIAGKRLRIAVVPFSEEKMLEFPVHAGALFHIEYNERHHNMGTGRALKLLEQAIAKKANIIIFPEYVCNIEIQKAIQERLRLIYEESPEKLNTLFLVIAGSGWAIDNNNVSWILSYNGHLLGKQYKFSKYSDRKRKGQELIEDLKNPGKETSIIEIEGIGKILTGICRDISERSYTRMLSRVFQPQLLLTPAWSGSVHMGFKEQFREITAENHRTCSVLCNCCEAIQSQTVFRTEIGMAMVPYKEGSVIRGKERLLKRNQECAGRCKDSGCIFIISMNFSPKMVREGKMVSWRKYVY